MRVKRVINLVLCCCLLLPGLLYAQSTKTVTLNLKEVPVKVFFDEIRKQTGLSFVYNTEQTKAMKPITVSVKNEQVESVLQQVFSGTEYSYQIEDKIVTIMRNPKAKSESRNLYGTVTDVNGESLPGVNVVLKGSSVGCMSDANGHFSLNIPREGSLVFSFIGMESQTVQTKGKTKLNITLQEDAQAMDEVIVTGLVTHNSKSFTGNASVYKGEDLKVVGHQNIIKSLALLDPSLSIVENTEMGSDPNTMPKIRFRGESSFQGFESIDKSGLMSDPNQPLFILDGYQTTLEKIVDLDMNRVESVTILKDAAAGAIYGSRAANGVIVVKTIQPKTGEMKISYSVDLDVNLPDLSTYDLLILLSAKTPNGMQSVSETLSEKVFGYTIQK